MKQTLLSCALLILVAGLSAQEAGLNNPNVLSPVVPNINPAHDNLRLIPVNPESITITVLNSTDVLLAWEPVSQSTDGTPLIPDGYKLYYASSPDQPWENFTYLDDATGTSYVHTGAAADYGHMFYYVTAFKNGSAIPENFIWVEGGTFYNTSSAVTISSFYIDKYELTQAGYQAVMGTNPASGQGVGDNYPVYLVSWFNAIEYCNRRSMQEGITPCYSYGAFGTDPDNWPVGWDLDQNNHINVSCDWSATGYRLPTEMEWEFAARGGNLSQGYNYSGSNNLNDVAWYFNNSGGNTHEVGTKAPNELGIYDMTGNVWEFAWDIYGPYPTEPQTDPTGAISGENRIIRGGSYSSFYFFCHVSLRNFCSATYSDPNQGFRVCRRL